MKVTVRFNEESNRDIESLYDYVEFTTMTADCVANWAEAVMDFLRPAFQGQHAIIAETFAISECPWSKLLEYVRTKDEADELIRLAEARKLEIDKKD